MAKYSDISCEIWEDLIDLKPAEKLVYIFLFSNPLCRPSGLYKIKLKTVELYTGISEGAWRGPIGGLIKYDENTSEMWVRGKVKHLRNLNDNWPLRKSIEADLDRLESIFIKSLFLEKYPSFLDKSLRGPIGPIRQGQGLRQGLEKIKGCGEKEKQKLVETPTRKNLNEPRHFYPPEVQALVRQTLTDLKKSQENP